MCNNKKHITMVRLKYLVKTVMVLFVTIVVIRQVSAESAMRGTIRSYLTSVSFNMVKLVFLNSQPI